MKNNRREGNKTAVTETDPTRPAYAGDDSERVTLDKLRKVNAGTNKSAETENLRYVRRVSRERARPPTPDFEDDLSTLPPRPAHAGDDWECVTVGMKLKDGKEVRRDKGGCVLNNDDDFEFEYAWEKREVHSHDSNLNFLKNIGAKISKATKRRKCRHRVSKAFAGTPLGYSPLEALKPHLPGIERKCAYLALADYNLQEHTDYRFVDIEAAGCKPVAGMMYCIIFQARANGQDHTFKAWVVTRRVRGLERRDILAIHVNAVTMVKPKSIYRSGTLQELI